jgi:hypothetical protein
MTSRRLLLHTVAETVAHHHADARMINVTARVKQSVAIWTFSCIGRRLQSSWFDYHILSACHWATAVRNPLPRFLSAADKTRCNIHAALAPIRSDYGTSPTFSNLLHTHICSRATLCHHACMSPEAWPLTHCPVPGGGYGRIQLPSLRDAGMHSSLSHLT